MHEVKENKGNFNDFVGENIVTNQQELTGLTSPKEQHGKGSFRPLAQAWITPTLLAENQQAWSKAYGRNLSEAETVEIIMNLRRLAEALLQANKERIDKP